MNEINLSSIDEAFNNYMKSLLDNLAPHDENCKAVALARVVDMLGFHMGTVEFMLATQLSHLYPQLGVVDGPQDEQIKEALNNARRFSDHRLAAGRVHGILHAGEEENDDILESNYMSPWSPTNQVNDVEDDIQGVLKAVIVNRQDDQSTH